MTVEPLKYSSIVYKQLMQKRVYKVLLVCSSYDAYIIEEDGRIDEQIFNEYVSLNLRYPPFFVIVHSAKAAFKELEHGDIDLVITMLSIRGMDLFEFAKKVKKNYEETPIVILTPFSRDISLRVQTENIEDIDFIFSWLGDTDIMLAIIKQVEDLLNAENDITNGVQAILLVEDSVRYYSSFLSIMYRMIFEHTKDLEVETLNEHQKMLRKRGRPKILLVHNFEDAVSFFEKYQNNLLGVITDVGFPVKGVRDKSAGIKLANYILEKNFHIPIMLQSSEVENKKYAQELGIGFLDKNSPKFLHKLRTFMRNYLAFGDFIFVNPTTKTEILRVPDLKSLKNAICEVSDNSLRYHLVRNHISKWMNARALFGLGSFLEQYTVAEFDNLKEIRQFIVKAIDKYRKEESSGVIALFNDKSYDQFVKFARVGDGMLGGKARGLAFLSSVISKHVIFESYENIEVSVPKTVVLTTDVFDKFMKDNNLFEFALSEVDDNVLLEKFMNSKFPSEYITSIRRFLEITRIPIAVRSSSLLEDSQYQPFAGVYSTYMIPFFNDINITLKLVIKAIKGVYASVYYAESKAYMLATQNVIDEEKMSVILQEICGKSHDGKFYPIISGVAKSINFYPIGSEKTEDGIVDIAFGLGKQIVEGEPTLHFSPAAPDKILQLTDPQTALQQTQKSFYAIDLTIKDFIPTTDDSVTLKKYRIKDAEADGTLDIVSSVYDRSNDSLNDGTHYEGKKVITFNNILKYNKFPFVDILKDVLRIGRREMGNPVEIEFAVNFDFKESDNICFKLLQIRPIVENKETIVTDLSKIDEKETIIVSENAMGNGVIKEICDLIYVKPEVFDSTFNPQIAEIIGTLNEKFINEKKNYFLIGPGRWGSRDRWLGIPVKWSQISAARIIIESGLENYRIEPSQGTHFFHNLTSFSVGYFTINPFINDGFYDIDYLNKQNAVYEDKYVRHIRFEKPLVAKIDGKKRLAVIMKPEETD
ncbi:MAG: phosphoenolpyruvate synthase [Bacteroidales bacterium]|nr:phosphoenolpyruvate synthase [Bacteroidales bacterium]